MISDMIPNNDSNWIIKGNTIYYNYLVKIPILTLYDDTYWVILDRRYTKAFIKMMIFLLKNNVEFYFKSRFINSKELFDENKISIDVAIELTNLPDNINKNDILNKITTLTNEQKIENKGFDTKTSFRPNMK